MPSGPDMSAGTLRLLGLSAWVARRWRRRTYDGAVTCEPRLHWHSSKCGALEWVTSFP